VHLSDFTLSQLRHTLNHQGLRLKIGPFVIRLRSNIDSISSCLSLLYEAYPLESSDSFSDFHLRLAPPPNLRRFYKPQVRFYFDEQEPFKPLPLAHAFPLFEWGLNWCIAKYAHQYLIFHSAVLEKNGKGLVLPGMPGAGKSTLCAALMMSGWRLLSDEMALLDPITLKLTPIPRPIALKNESIDIIQALDHTAVIGPRSYDTSKGTVAHLKPTDTSIRKASEEVSVNLVVIPKYKAAVKTSLTSMSNPEMLNHLISNSFNYNILRESAFESTCKLLDMTGCHTLEYSELGAAITCLDKLVVCG